MLIILVTHRTKKEGGILHFNSFLLFFGGTAYKYIPMSAINGLRIVLSCENVNGAFVQNGLRSGAAGDGVYLCTDITINDPTFFLNMVRVDPTVDQQLIAAAKNPEDGNIRIHSQTYSSYQMNILANQSTFEYIIPIRVSSLKALYFTFAPTSQAGQEDFVRCDGFTSS